MHSRKRGKSGSKRPGKREKRSWVRHTAKEIEQVTIKLGKQGLGPSQIGIKLRDSYGVPDVKAITKKKISEILKENKLLTKIPEDLSALIKKDIKLMKHIETHRKDMTVKRGIQLTESKIRRLAKYYKKKSKLSADWKYDRTKAKLLVE